MRVSLCHETLRFFFHFLMRAMPFDILAAMSRFLFSFAVFLAVAVSAPADTLHLKDGSTVTGVIVGFDQNSFRVKTQYGSAMVRRDAVVEIDIGDAAPATKPGMLAPEATTKPAVTTIPDKPDKTATATPPQPATSTTPAPAAAKPTSTSPGTQPAAITNAKPAANAPAQPSSSPGAAAGPATTATAKAPIPGGPSATAAPPLSTAKPAATKPSAAAKPGDEAIREETSATSYTNLTYGFQMYKPPTWQIVEGAHKILPGTITALGTADETTYLLIGTSPPTGSLKDDLKSSDVKLHDMFEDYRLVDDSYATIGGVNSVLRKFRGSIDGREWSGMVVLFERDQKMYTILGMTQASSDLVQMQENVMQRAITSLKFTQ